MRILIVGATGVVGQEIIHCLEKRKFPLTSLRLAASKNSAGKIIKTAFGKITVEEINAKIFKNVDIALLATDGKISAKLAKIATNNGCIVIDNSSYFRYISDVPLIIPEINGDIYWQHHGIIASPNCTTAIAAIPLWIIEKNYGLKKVIISSYQAASGAGQAALEELKQQTTDYARGKKLTVKNFAYQLLFNVIPQIDVFQENNYTKEEMKIVWELRKIFNKPKLNVSCTAVRVPTLRAHSESIVVETKKPINSNKVRELFRKTAGIKVVDEPKNLLYPMPLNATEKFDVEVGRIRQSLIFGKHGLEFFISGDQLLKGAALNVVQIAELFIKNMHK